MERGRECKLLQYFLASQIRSWLKAFSLSAYGSQASPRAL